MRACPWRRSRWPCGASTRRVTGAVPEAGVAGRGRGPLAGDGGGAAQGAAGHADGRRGGVPRGHGVGCAGQYCPEVEQECLEMMARRVPALRALSGALGVSGASPARWRFVSTGTSGPIVRGSARWCGSTGTRPRRTARRAGPGCAARTSGPSRARARRCCRTRTGMFGTARPATSTASRGATTGPPCVGAGRRRRPRSSASGWARPRGPATDASARLGVHDMAGNIDEWDGVVDGRSVSERVEGRGGGAGCARAVAR
jgi:hypothetical protein